MGISMETIIIQIDAEIRRLLQKQAQTRGISLNELITELLRQHAYNDWPDSVRHLVGSWGNDFPEPDELRRSLEVESPRESP
jgi:hypothetical protein